jgi:hypothetical protein
MLWKWLIKQFNIWVFIGALGVLFFLVLFWIGFLWLFSPSTEVIKQPTAIILVIPAPSATPIPAATEPLPLETDTNQEGISVGNSVKIIGTGAEGLRLRKGPGIDQDILFIALESSIFIVKDGPQQIDNYTWWYLEGVTEPTKNGWAASNYLQVVEP